MTLFPRRILAAALVVAGISPMAQVTAKTPIVYHEKYNVQLPWGVRPIMSALHPFDGTKYQRIAQIIATTLNMNPMQDWYQPEPATETQKLLVHTPAYLASLQQSATLSEALDMGGLLAWLPRSFFTHVLEPETYATGGTILAVQLALEHGWAINLSGGYHHAAPTHAEGGCIFSDVPIALKALWQHHPAVNVLIIDLDAHQGNGFQKALADDSRVFYFDMFNPSAGHTDDALANGPSVHAVRLNGGMLSSEFYGVTLPDITERCINRSVDDIEYHNLLVTHLAIAFERAEQQFGAKPDLIIYNAGSDINSNDPWGCLNVSEQGIIERDKYVITEAIKRQIPFCMVLSGSYFPRSAEVIGKSIASFVPLLQQGVHRAPSETLRTTMTIAAPTASLVSADIRTQVKQ